MNDRTIDIRNYWSKVVRDTAEFQQIANAINPELNKLLECIKRALQDSFINDATEYGVQRWESILKIEPLETDTLDDRKVRILTYLTTQVPYSTRVVKRMIASFVGEDNYDFQFCNEKDELWLGLTVTNEQVIEEIKNLLSNVLPMHIVPIYERLWYDKCKTVADMIAVNPDYKNHLDNGVWNHRLSSLTNAQQVHDYNANLKRFEIELPSVTLLGWAFRQSGLEKLKLVLPNAINIQALCEKCPDVYSIWVDAPKATNISYLAWTTPNLKSIYLDCPNATNAVNAFASTKNCESYEFPSGFPNVTNANSMFNSSGLTKIEWEFPKAQDCKYMFNSSGLKGDIEVDLPEATDCRWAFYGTCINSFKGSLPKCTNISEMLRGSYLKEATITDCPATGLNTMVYGCRYLRKFNMDMGNVTSLSYFGENTSFEEFKWNLRNLVNGGNAFYTENAYPTSGAKRPTEFNSALPKLENGNNMLGNRPSLRTLRYPIDVNGQSIYESGLPQDGDKYAYLTLPSLIQGVGMFFLCRLDKPSAVSVLNSLQQAYTHSNKNAWKLTIGIHVDHKTDEEVLQAISNVEAKGWTITVQWNGTPTSGISTLDLDFIYAKRTQNDEGIYIDENGTRWDVDWGHYVTGSDYTEYNSEEEALAGLTFCGSMLPEPEMEE